MPATMKSVTSKTNTLDVEIDGDPKGITLQYTTRKVTKQAMDAMQELIESGDPNGLDAVIEQMLLFVTAWNFAPDEGEPPLPLTREALATVPLDILAAVMTAVTDDQSPKATTDG